VAGLLLVAAGAVAAAGRHLDLGGAGEVDVRAARRHRPLRAQERVESDAGAEPENVEHRRRYFRAGSELGVADRRDESERVSDLVHGHRLEVELARVDAVVRIEVECERGVESDRRDRVSGRLEAQDEELRQRADHAHGDAEIRRHVPVRQLRINEPVVRGRCVLEQLPAHGGVVDVVRRTVRRAENVLTRVIDAETLRSVIDVDGDVHGIPDLRLPDLRRAHERRFRVGEAVELRRRAERDVQARVLPALSRCGIDLAERRGSSGAKTHGFRGGRGAADDLAVHERTHVREVLRALQSLSGAGGQ
jgi:hypothetical protein